MPVLLEESFIYGPYDAYLSQIISDRFRYEEFHNKLRQLSDIFFNFVLSIGPGDFIKDRIATPLNLNQNQSKEIAIIVMKLILVDSYLGDIVNQITQRVFVDEQKAKIIAGLIVSELFAPILNELKKKHVEKYARSMPLQPRRQDDDRTVDLRKEIKT